MLPGERLELHRLKDWADNVPTGTAKLKLTLAVVMVTVFGLGGAWATSAKIGGALVTSGQVFAEGSNYAVQHLEGGIIREISVREGDIVKAGEVIANLDDTASQSQLNRVQIERAINLIELDRWRTEKAENKNNVTIDISGLGATANHPRVIEAIESQQNEYSSAKAAREQRLLIIDGKIANENEDIRYLTDQIQSFKEQRELLIKEESDMTELLEKGLTQRSRVFNLRRQLSDIDAKSSNVEAAIQKSKHNIKALLDEKDGIMSSHREMVNKKINELQKQINQNEDYIVRLADLIERSNIRSPVSGTVINVPVKSIGSVLKPGSTFAEVLPDGATLQIEAPVASKDISKVHIGQTADVVFPDDQMHLRAPMEATVTYISADSFTSERSGYIYYIARLNIKNYVVDRKILPGNTVEVFFKTDPKTLVEYLAEPITRFYAKAYTD